MDAGRIWWESVPSASGLIERAKDSLRAFKSVALRAEMTDWVESFLWQTLERVREEDYDIADYELNCEDISRDTSLLDYVADTLGIGYMKERSIRGLLPEIPESGMVLLVRNVDARRLEEIEGLIRQIVKAHAPVAFLFIKTEARRCKGMTELEMTVTKLELQYYVWTLLLGKIPDYLLDYASHLIVELSYPRPDESAHLCEHVDELLERPDEYCTWLSEEESLTAVHAAQVKGIEPYIEYGRAYLISKLKNRISFILPFVDEYGSVFEKPVEVELRHLIHYRKDLNLSDKEAEILELLYEARNKISHLDLLSYELANRILEYAGEWQ